jgi:hypothetical protein
MFNRSLAFIAITILVLVSSCKKAPGEGGFASISGRIYVKNYDATYTVVQSEYYLPGENVHIIYGDGTEVGNTVKTSYDGSFVFNFLQKGKYKIFAIGEDTTKPNLSVPKEVMMEVTITSKKQKLDLGIIEIAE